MYGHEPINLIGLEQLVDDSQTNAITVMLDYFRHIIECNPFDLKRSSFPFLEKESVNGMR
jgi:hypothetical protein